MKTLILNLKRGVNLYPILLIVAAVLGLYLCWQLLPIFLTIGDATVGMVDAGIWQLLLFGLITWLLLVLLSVSLFGLFLRKLALPSISNMVSQFNDLSSWYQLGFYWASFALLLLAGVGCLAAVF